MGDDAKQAVLRILPGLQYLAWAAHDSGAGPVSGWIGETIARIVDWADGAEPQPIPQARRAVQAALADILREARGAGLDDTVRRLEDSLAALENERRERGE